MKKTYYLGVIAATTILFVPAFLNAQTLMDTSAATGIGASIDANSGKTAVGVEGSIRDKIRADYENHVTNIKNNSDYRNVMLGTRASTTIMTASTTRPVIHPPIMDRGDNNGRNASSTSGQKDGEYRNLVASTTIQKMHEEMDNVRQFRVQALNMQKVYMVKALNQAISNLEQIRGRIDGRITKAEQGGKNMNTAKNLLLTADAKLTLAKQAVLALQTFNASSTITTTATSTVDLSKPRQLLNSANQAVKVARDALNAVVVEIAHDMGLKLGDNEHQDATSTATSTAVNASSSVSQ